MIDETAVPELIWGTYPEVLARCKTAAAEVLARRSWEPLVSAATFRPLESLPGHLVVDAYPEYTGISGEHVFLAPLLNEIAEAFFRSRADKSQRRQYYPALRDLIVSGMDSFWLSLITLGEGCWPNGSTWAPDPEENAAAYRTAARKLLRWWPRFMPMSERFDWRWRGSEPRPPAPGDWYRWGQRLIHLCIEAGMPTEIYRPIILLPAPDAAAEVRRWLDLEERGTES